MTAAEENLFRRLLSQCDARNRFTPSIPSEDVRAFEALAFELHYIQQANAQGAYMLTDAGVAARRTLIMQDEQRARLIHGLAGLHIGTDLFFCQSPKAYVRGINVMECSALGIHDANAGIYLMLSPG